MNVPARFFAVGLAAWAAFALSACGTSGSTSGAISPAAEPPSNQLMSSMQQSVRQASSVHVAGHLTNNGTPISVDLDLHKNGEVAGTVSQNGAPFQVIGVDDKIYVKATAAFLKEVKAPSGACSVVCGKWLQLTPAEAGQLTGDLSMNSLTRPLVSGKIPKLTETGNKVVNGQGAWVLRAGDGSTLDVSSAGQHYPLVASTGTSPHQVVTYSHWNSVPAPTAPPANQVLNLNQLK